MQIKKPPMGWNTWNTFGKNINEKLIMESTHRELSTGLADGLRRNNSDCLTDVNKLAVCKVSSVTLCANADFAVAFEGTSDFNPFDACVNNTFCLIVVKGCSCLNYNLARFGVGYGFYNGSSVYSVKKRLYHFVSVHNIACLNIIMCSAVMLADNNISQYVFRLKYISCG